ncbi:MAG: hypothetical protein OHK0015_01510 [Chloroflexi bacterium OHK40]
MDRDFLLGYVFERFITNGRKVALLRPTHRLDEDSQRWVAIEQPTREFPNRGCVTWINAPDEAPERSIWMFEYGFHDSFDLSSPRGDRYRIDFNRQPESPVEVIKLQVSGIERVQRALAKGLLLAFVPTRHVYIVVDGDSWVGPVRLVSRGERWFIDPHIQALPIPCVAPVASADLFTLKIGDRHRALLRHKIRPEIKLGEVDWADDALNLKRVLEWAREQPAIAQPLELTKRVIKQVVEALPSDDNELLAQRVRRARSFVEELGELAKDTAAFEQEILTLPQVRQRLEAAEREGRAAAKMQAEAEAIARARAELEATKAEQERLTETLAGLRQALEAAEKRMHEADQHARAAVDAELARRRQELEALDNALTERRQQLETDLGLMDAAMSERLAELSRRPAETLAQIAIFRAVLAAQGVAGATHSAGASQLRPPSTALLSGEAQAEDQKDLVNAAKQASVAAGDAPSVGAALHSALVGGTVPLLAGPGALDILEGYASVAAGGRFLSVTVSPAALEPADLLAKFDVNSQRLVLHPSGLLDLLLYAGQPEQREKLFLAVLDGVNRSAAEAYLLPILACYSAAWDKHRQRALHLFHPSALAPADPYAVTARLVWPRNVLLAGTLVEGGATVPLPPALWSHAILISTGEAPASTKLKGRVSPPLTSASSLKWASWRSLAMSDLESGLEALDEIKSDGLRLPAPIAHAFARAYVSSSHWLKSSEARRLAVRGVLLPYALATGQIEALTEALELAEVRLSEADLDGVRQVIA